MSGNLSGGRAMLSIENLVKAFAPRPGTQKDGAARPANAVDGISFHVREGDFFTLLGPSGCGKTTTLQCIAGLETPTSGRIEIGGATVFCSRDRVMVPSNRRDLGMIFQSYAIWPHMNVFDNVAFPLVHGGRRVAAADARRRVMAALELVKLHDYAHRPSPHLSGGQQQRVALARALVHEPRLLLLDEPLSNLDAKLRDTMRVELRQLVKSLGITTIFVTHDQIEAMAMSDEILLMRAGGVVQQGAPRDIFLGPASVFAADFMGRSNVVSGTVETSGPEGSVATSIGSIRCAIPPGATEGVNVNVVIRPHSVTAAHEATPPNGENVFSGVITQLQFLGDAVETDIDVDGTIIRAMLDPYRAWELGQNLRIVLPRERCVVVGADGDVAKSSWPTLPKAVTPATQKPSLRAVA
jgi:iron(III) transport system ATP-binding protein